MQLIGYSVHQGSPWLYKPDRLSHLKPAWNTQDPASINVKTEMFFKASVYFLLTLYLNSESSYLKS